MNDMIGLSPSASGRSTPNSIAKTSLQPSPQPKTSFSTKSCYEEGDFFYYDATSGSSIKKKNYHEVIYIPFFFY